MNHLRGTVLLTRDFFSLTLIHRGGGWALRWLGCNGSAKWIALNGYAIHPSSSHGGSTGSGFYANNLMAPRPPPPPSIRPSR